MNNEVRKYLAEIGRRGGQKSRRKLTRFQSLAMRAAKTAKRALKLKKETKP
jgi:general stress protein YciG